MIALGTFLLSLPVASKHGRLDVLDAMFTATSATCVTGLIVRDTWTQFTYFGQAVILLLIQVGGLGLVTLTSFFALAMRRRMGFRDLRLLGESVSADGYAQAKDVLKIVVGLAGLFEGIGILLLLFVFVPQFGLEAAGIYELFVPGVGVGDLYKYEIWGADGRRVMKADPYGNFAERRPATASIVWNIEKYNWNDRKWMDARKKWKPKKEPMLVYEVALGAFRKPDGEEKEFYNYL